MAEHGKLTECNGNNELCLHVEIRNEGDVTSAYEYKTLISWTELVSVKPVTAILL